MKHSVHLNYSFKVLLKKNGFLFLILKKKHFLILWRFMEQSTNIFSSWVVLKHRHFIFLFLRFVLSLFLFSSNYTYYTLYTRIELLNWYIFIIRCNFAVTIFHIFFEIFRMQFGRFVRILIKLRCFHSCQKRAIYRHKYVS